MFKFFISLLIFAIVSLSAESNSTETTEVLLQAENIYGNGDDLYAKGFILLHYQDIQLMADFAHYDKQKKLLIVSGSVRIVNSDGSRVETEKVTFEVDDNSIVFKKFFYIDREKVWLSSAAAQKKKNCYSLEKAAFSTCAVTNPDWRLGFAEAKYNAKTKYIKLKDIKFYVGDTPIFYFPYLAFSTSRERSSGLLMPRFGHNTKEGLLYEQPVYWAISPSIDLEFNPQVRTNRGGGIYTTFRFADSNHSDGIIRVGYFADRDTFASDHNLENDSHYGFEGVYKSSDLLEYHKPAGYHDLLYANILFFNDIDYINLQKDRLSHLSDSYLKESRINYILYSQDQYFGLNIKHFQDAKKKSDKETLQEIPSLRWHKYSNGFGSEDFSYSIDAKLSNYTRVEGTESKQFEVSIPLIYNFAFFDDYLKVELSEELFMFKGAFDEVPAGKDSYSTAISTHKIRLYSDLVKAYENRFHAMQWSVAFEKQNYLGDGFEAYRDLGDALKRDFIPREPFDERVTLSLGQYWYTDDLALDLRQRISQAYYPNRDEKWGDLRHELDLRYGKWNLSHLFEYSFEHQGFSEISNKLLYDAGDLQFNIEYFWRKNLDLGTIITNEIALGGKYQYSKELKLFASVTYDLEQKRSKKWSSGIRYDKGCWAIEFSYEHDTKPILEENGGGSISNNTFLVKLSLVPFGESEIRQ